MKFQYRYKSGSNWREGYCEASSLSQVRRKVRELIKDPQLGGRWITIHVKRLPDGLSTDFSLWIIPNDLVPADPDNGCKHLWYCHELETLEPGKAQVVDVCLRCRMLRQSLEIYGDGSKAYEVTEVAYYLSQMLS